MGIRTVYLSALLALAGSAVAPGALAQDPSPAASPSALPRANYFIQPGEMLEVYGSYRLDDGRVLHITREQRRYWAELDGVGKREILPVGSIMFVTRDGGHEYEFTPLAFTTEVKVTPPVRYSGAAAGGSGQKMR